MTGRVVPFVPAWVRAQLRWVERVDDDVRARCLACVVADRLLHLLRRSQVDEDVAVLAILGLTLRFADDPWSEKLIEGLVALDSETVRREAGRLLGDHPAHPRDRLLGRLVGHR